jgi:hypothetical protein
MIFNTSGVKQKRLFSMQSGGNKDIKRVLREANIDGSMEVVISFLRKMAPLCNRKQTSFRPSPLL